jgi:hypothetical protein
MLLVIILLFGCSSCAERITSRAQTTAASESAPPPNGWVAYPKPAEDSDALRCANYSEREWWVERDGEHLQIRLNTKRDHQDALPAGITAKNVAVGSKADRHVIPVNDGWLVGMDVGEFGGGLWWFSSNDRRSKKLSDENVHGFANTSIGIMAFVGLAHLGLDSGHVLRITDGKAGNRKVKVLAELGSAPEAFVVESPDTVIIMTTMGLVRVRTSGVVERLLTTNYESLYPNSLTLSTSGVLYVGMRHFVTRLTPTGNTYKEEWFVPEDCTKFTIRDLDCVCIPGGQ